MSGPLQRFEAGAWLGGSRDWGLLEARERDGQRRDVLIATTAPHVAPSDVLRARFQPADDGPVIALGVDESEGTPIDFLVELRPAGRPAACRGSARIHQTRALELLTAAARSIAKVHQAGLVVGSLRPELVFVDDDDRLTGVAPYSEIFFRDVAPQSRGIRYPFEELYMAPELVQVAPFGEAADVFCLAACYVRWVSGRYPFAGATFLERVMALAEAKLAPDIAPEALPAMIRAGLRAAPEQRPTLRELMAQ